MSLSDRIRPSGETAPWVVEEVQKLEAEVGQLRTALKLLWEEATDESRCAVERSAGDYAHQISQPCRKLVETLIREEKP